MKPNKDCLFLNCFLGLSGFMISTHFRGSFLLGDMKFTFNSDRNKIKTITWIEKYRLKLRKSKTGRLNYTYLVKFFKKVDKYFFVKLACRRNILFANKTNRCDLGNWWFWWQMLIFSSELNLECCPCRQKTLFVFLSKHAFQFPNCSDGF